ncbi:MAG: phosphate signaling complex protein PhoU [Gammaproteobacteria bacterium]|uniref:phosphate signaling complex protein PhoU n=1 Tax=Alcanivorax sp. TaxID=1872427 RepID=UPI000C0D3DB2|nr:phosphate signaling complex protein PhoU [Alcanivorax sp.]MBL4852467.1 phosphate signaling complex protein PhoU [Gammaproteobacteria bacterium]PHR67515.1 MAG: phosphate transport system regulatory protein PhoU [Alcanivorax sp.]
MDSYRLGRHISHQFDNELENIRNRVLVMGGMVEELLQMAIVPLLEGNESPEKLVRRDEKINQLEIEIDECCSQILARRQPTARDLRLVIAVGKAISDLERIGDEAKMIARKTDDSKVKESRPYYNQLKVLVERVQGMLNQALDAFARMDAESAVEVARQDKNIDDSYGELLRSLINDMEDSPKKVRRSVELMWITRSLERIGDHAANICEHVVYVVKGKDVRHLSLDEMEDEVNRPW